MAGILKVQARGASGILYVVGTHKGKRVRISTQTTNRHYANKVMEKIRSQIDNDTFTGIVPVVTFNEAAKSYLKQAKSIGDSSYYYVTLFQAYWKQKRLKDIRPQDALQYIEERRKKKISDGTIAREIRQAQAILNYALRMDWLDKAVQLPRPTEDNERTRWEPVATIDRLVELAREDNEHIADLFLFLAHTGARLGEALSTTSKDFLLDDEGKPTAVIFHSKKGRRKKRRSRAVPLNRRAMEAVMKRWPITNNHGLLFPALGADARIWLKNQSRSRIRACWRLACAKADLNDLTLHDLRHCFASWAAMKGASDLDLMRLLGHTKVEMVKRYAHLNPEVLLPIIDFMMVSQEETVSQAA